MLTSDQRAELDREAAEFFAKPPNDRAERAAYAVANLESWTRGEDAEAPANSDFPTPL